VARKKEEWDMNRRALLALTVLIAVVAVASWATAAKLLCISTETLKGEETVASCLARGEEFAVVGDDGLVRILTPREVELSKRFNPEILSQRAFGLKFRELAPEIDQIKRRAVFGPGQ